MITFITHFNTNINCTTFIIYVTIISHGLKVVQFILNRGYYNVFLVFQPYMIKLEAIIYQKIQRQTMNIMLLQWEELFHQCQIVHDDEGNIHQNQ